MTINIVYSSYLCSRSTHEQHDPSTSVGVCTLWRHNVTQYNSTFNCIVHKIYQFIVSSQLYRWQFVSCANCEQNKVELISYFLLYVYTENDTEKFCWVDEKCKVHKLQRNTAKWAPDHKDNSKHVNTCTVDLYKDLYKMNLTLPLTDQQQLIELHQWTSGVAFQWERAMDLAEALPVNQ